MTIHSYYQTASKTLDGYYSSTCQTASKKYNEGTRWLTNRYTKVYAKLPQLDGFLDRQIDAAWKQMNSLNGRRAAWWKGTHAKLPSFASKTMHAGPSFVWRYKKEIAGSIVIGGGLLYLYHLWKNRPQKPIAQLKSSIHWGKLSIEVPIAEPVPPCATLVFCIDTSGSMNPGDRSGAVKKALNDLLDHAQGLVDNSGAEISIEIVGFNDRVKVITPMTRLTKKADNQEIKKNIADIACRDGTRILAGLEQATKDLIAGAQKIGSRTVILLTDGEENNLDEKTLAAIHERLKRATAHLFAVGIGENHNKGILKKIVANNEKNYIDTTLPNASIETAIDEIYKSAIRPFSKMKLACSQLPAKTWMINRLRSVQGDQQSEVDIGDLTPGEKIEARIRIDYLELDNPVDLRDVKFRLIFTDPSGRPGEVSLPWNPTTIIDPEVFLA